jgi:hypothetical protein
MTTHGVQYLAGALLVFWVGVLVIVRRHARRGRREQQ